MSQSHFFAHLSRLKLINRWPLMRNVRTENVSEHSLQVAMVAHALAAIKNRKFNGRSIQSASPCWRCTTMRQKC
jgi:5'-deoxynucleotidase